MGKRLFFIISGLLLVLPLIANRQLVYAQDNTQNTVLLGNIRNNTAKPLFNDLSTAIHDRISTSIVSIRTVLDTFSLIDSVPDQSMVVSARDCNAAYIVWGSADTLAGGCLINLRVQNINSGGITHFRILMDCDESKGLVVSAVVSKLQFWLERILMAHITVMTEPPAVTLLLDGAPLGTTPFEGLVQPGNYTLEMRKTPLLPLRIPVTFSSGTSYHYDFNLTGGGTDRDRRSALRWLAGASLCFVAGTGAAYMRSLSIDSYIKAKPPSDFDRLHAISVAWNITTIALFSAGGAAICTSIFKVVF
ncbi:MAG: PEGA domain-containing protein [Chitinispirillaceae bacterium]|nr:PEGA domain-containing protein [Chitinispirillaceae bacterium]